MIRSLGLALAALLWAAGVEAAQHDALAELRQRGYLRMCADPANLPFSSREPATPGFEVELARRIAGELGVELRVEWRSTYMRALRPLRDGACDLFMGLPEDARFREGNPWIAVSRPYYVMRHAIVSRTAASVATLGDLKGHRVAVELASIAEVYLGYHDLRRGLYRTEAEAFRAVAHGEAGAALLWLPAAAWLARGRADLSVAPVSDGELDFPIGAGVRRRDRGLGEAVDGAIATLQERGTVQEILTRYGAIGSPRAARRDAFFVLAQAKDPVDLGRSLFSTACSRCHGADGVGGGTGGAVPPLKNYDGGLEKFMRILMTGRKNTAMGGFKGILTDDEGLAIYKYLTATPKQ